MSHFVQTEMTKQDAGGKTESTQSPALKSEKSQSLNLRDDYCYVRCLLPNALLEENSSAMSSPFFKLMPLLSTYRDVGS